MTTTSSTPSSSSASPDPLTPLVLRPHITATPTADGMVLLDQRTGAYWQMNTTATLVLHALLDGADAEQAAALLAARHPAAAERADSDVAALIRQLHDAGLAQPRDGARERGPGRGSGSGPNRNRNRDRTQNRKPDQESRT
ncbi:lasso peptide biosynthesis PqqD family chaperone [Streptomyces armeniacus]|uniref:Lasso peptide biosynthesis PqqD family chaperone n=1 Tax=Streptomyces armeniacus TaxID=83291 RepID=A0A345XMV1_9ACTN|nr:lasso peptide biosynthesis PqqD family chaperone [Streptomyces armeniacus]